MRLKSANSTFLMSFNRTFMELKFIPEDEITFLDKSFNRTFMELKFQRQNLIIFFQACFNRTFMELKFV